MGSNVAFNDSIFEKRKKVKKKQKLCPLTVPNSFGEVSGNKELFLRLNNSNQNARPTTRLKLTPITTFVFDKGNKQNSKLI